MRPHDDQQHGRSGGEGAWPAGVQTPGWVFCGFWVLLLAGAVLVGGPWAGYHGLMLGGAGLLMAIGRPVVGLPRLWWLLAGVFVVAGWAVFLPAGWFSMPAWRGQLAALGAPVGSLVTMQPQQSAETLGLFALMLLTGLWLAGQRATALQLRCWSLAFTLGVAGVAVLAKVLQSEPVSGIPGGGAEFGFFPNRNHTGTYLAMGVICGFGSALQAFRDQRYGSLVAGLLGTGICCWAVVGWSISRGGLVLVAVGVLAWLLLVGTRYLGKGGRWAVGLGVLGVVGLFVAADSAAKRRLGSTLDQTGAVIARGEAFPPTGLSPVGTVVDLDFRIPVALDAWQLVREFPWTGVGAGQFFYVFPQYRHLTVTRNDSDCHHPDNDWLWMLAETGPLATAALLALVCLAGWKSLRGILRGRDRALRGGCLIAALLVPFHGWFDVPGHRLTLAWSSAFLFCLSLGPPAARQARQAVVTWPSWVVASGMLLAAVVLARAQWLGGPQPAMVVARVAVEQALELYRQDLELQAAALKRGVAHQPAAADDLLEKALAVLDAAAGRVPLDREIPHVRGLLAVQFDDKLALAERAFAVERALDPSWVAAPLQEAVALGSCEPARAAELWREALRRAERVDRVKPGTVWGREYTLGRIKHSVKGRPELEGLVPQGDVGAGPVLKAGDDR